MNRPLVSMIAVAVALLASCGSANWRCVEDGQTQYSVNARGEVGRADKGCSCDEMRAFNVARFGDTDEASLRSDFGCR